MDSNGTSDDALVINSLEPRHYYLAQWEWYGEGNTGYWGAPSRGARQPDAIGVLDLRTLPQMGKSGGISEGYGIFAYRAEKNIPGSIYVGSDLDGNLKLTEQKALQDILKLRKLPTGTWRDVLWDIFTTYSDPTGKTAPKPLAGKLDGTVKLYLNGFGMIKEEEFNNQHRQRSIAVFQDDYKRKRRDGVSLKVLHRWTGETMQELYGRMDAGLAKEILPNPYKEDGWKKPETTITDNFNRADSSDLGANWTESQGDFQILTNVLDIVSLTTSWAVAKHNTALSSANHYVQANVNRETSGNQVGPGMVGRFADTSNYYYCKVDISGIDDQRIYKIVTGTRTSLGEASDDWNNGSVMKLEIDGSSLKMYEGATLRVSVTDTAITGNTTAGVVTNDATATIDWDNFEAADLAAAYQPRPAVINSSNNSFLGF